MDGPLDIFPIDLLQKIVLYCLKRPKINEKEAWVGPFLNSKMD